MTQRAPHSLTVYVECCYRGCGQSGFTDWAAVAFVLVSGVCGLASVMLLGTLNRAIVELSVPAMIVAIMIVAVVLIAPFRALIGFDPTHIVLRLAGNAFHLFGLVRFGRWWLLSCHFPYSFYRASNR